MKVVLFCGGQGMRMREYSESIPKPMVPIGPRPLLWHLMKYYATYGHKDFILCLGYRGDAIKNYFLKYDECVSNDFVLSDGAKHIEMISTDIADWRITFVETGLHANIGQRLLKVKKFIGDDRIFMANYADGLTDVSLPSYIEYFNSREKVASFLAVPSPESKHFVSFSQNGTVTDISNTSQLQRRINAGFFVFRRQIFDYIQEGEELVERPFRRLIDRGNLVAYPYDGFWACADTFKERQHLDDLYTSGKAPWEIWRRA